MGLPHKSDASARPLQILVSLRAFGTESDWICSFRYRLGLCIKKFAKKAVTLTSQKPSLRVSLSLSHPDIGFPQGFNFNFPTSIPFTFIWSPPGDYPQHRHINSDDFGGHLVLRIEDEERNISNKDRCVIGLEIAKILYHLFKRVGLRTYKIVKSSQMSLLLVAL